MNLSTRDDAFIMNHLTGYGGHVTGKEINVAELRFH